VDKRLLCVLLVALVVALGGCGRREAPDPNAATAQGSAGADAGTQAEGRVTVGSKNFTEQVLLGEMMSQLIEAKTDLRVDRKLNLAGTQVCFEALKSGELDIYADYTGTALTAILKQEVSADSARVYDAVKSAYEEQFGITWLEPLGFNNTYTLTMRRAQAAELGVKTISDLAPLSKDLVLGASYEFLERPDGYPGLQELYGLDFSQAKGMDAGLTYRAVASEKVDVIDGFATDGRIPAFDLLILEDDRGFFPPYDAAPLVRQDTLEKHPELAEALNLLAGRLPDDKMRDMNYRVDEKNEQAADVAREFLESEGLLDQA